MSDNFRHLLPTSNVTSTIIPSTESPLTENHVDRLAPYISIIVLSVLTILFNSAIVLVIPFYPNLRSRNSNKFLLNLMISNLCVGLVMLCYGAVVLSFNAAEHTDQNHSKPPASISLMFGVLILLSVMNMIILTGDRLYAVKWTFRYFDSITSRRIHTVIVLPWVISFVYFIVLVTLINIGNDHTKDIVQHIIYISFDFIAIVGFLTLTVSSSVIYREARIQLLRIARTSVTSSIIKAGIKQDKDKTLKVRELRLAVINVGLVIKFVVFWLPTLATMTYHLIYEAATSEFVEYLSLHLVLVNCVCDPTVYVLLSRDIHRAILHLTLGKEVTDLFPIIRKNDKAELV